MLGGVSDVNVHCRTIFTRNCCDFDFNLGCDEIWCPTETQIGTEWFPWTTGGLDWGSAIGSDKNAQNAQTLFILFVIQGTV